MKELLSFFASATKPFVGHRFIAPEDPGSKSPIAQERLDLFGEAFHCVEDDNLDRLVASLDSMKMTDRVVVFEGAFTGAICLDISRPLEFSRADELARLAPSHTSGLGLGVGHALSTLQSTANITPELSEDFYVWLAMDSYGMHEGYFRWCDSIHKMQYPDHLPFLARAAFDQGLGRGLWFITGGDANATYELVSRFPHSRRCNMWRGIGLMTGFWGAGDEKQLKKLYKLSGDNRAYFQQGVAQAVSMRFDLNEVVDHTQAVSEIICGASATKTAEMAHELMDTLLPKAAISSRSVLESQNKLVAFFSD